MFPKSRASLLLLVASVEDAEVRRIGAPIDADRARMRLLGAIASRDEITGGTIRRFQPDLAGSLELRRVRVARSLSPPIIEEPGRLLILLHRLAPISRR